MYLVNPREGRAAMTRTATNHRSARAFLLRAARALRQTEAAIDLASIMVGVLIVGILAGVISASIFGVIPWSQDAAAKSALDSVRTAESTTRVMDGKYAAYASLVASGKIQGSSTVTALIDDDGTCYVGLSASATGRTYFSTSENPEVKELTGENSLGCVSASEIADAADSIGSASGGGSAAPDGSGEPDVSNADITVKDLYLPYVALSGDGKIATGTFGSSSGAVHRSTDSGSTWADTSATGSKWGGLIASSADGSTLLTAGSVGSGPLYASTDGGATWVTSTVKQWWGQLDMSSDGSVMYATGSNGSTLGKLYKSTNAGASWTEVFSESDSTNISNVAVSADGQKLALFADGATPSVGALGYFSDDGGQSWETVIASDTGFSTIQSVSMSSDGNTVLVSWGADYDENPELLITHDFGDSWSKLSNPSEGSYLISADGKVIVGKNNFDPVLHISTNGGASFDELAIPYALDGYMALSDDGKVVMAAGYDADWEGILTIVKF